MKSMSFEQQKAELEKWTGRLEHHPHRIEQVFMNLEHHRITGTMVWLASISRDAAGKPTSRRMG
jgi:hypothetical protein